MIFRSFYNFLEFPEYLELKIIPENELWRQHDLMLTSAGQRAVQVKPDVWGPHVSDTGANPVSTQALTRYGAHCQCHGVSLTGSLVLIRRATSAVTGVWPATTKTAAGARRSGAASGFGPSQGHQRVALACAHPKEACGRRGVAGARRSGGRGGCRSSGLGGARLGSARGLAEGLCGLLGRLGAR